MLAATVNANVACLEEDELRSFHTIGGRGRAFAGNGADDAYDDGQVGLRYMPVLMSIQNPLIPTLLMGIVDRLAPLFPKQQRTLTVMRNNLAWKSIVEPAR